MISKEEAEHRISKILERLEIDTGQLVDSINIIDTDVTNVGSDKQEIARKVVIKLVRIPGSSW